MRRVRYLGYRLAGWFDTQGGTGEILLAHGSFEPADRAFENYVRAAVAWQSLRRGGALVHAASAVRDGRGYLFFGESGAGKSTLSASTRRATILSDDLSLVLPSADGQRSGASRQPVPRDLRGRGNRFRVVSRCVPVSASFRRRSRVSSVFRVSRRWPV